MPPEDRDWLLRHLYHQARYLAALTGWALDNPGDAGVLLRARDETFTLRETLATLGVPNAIVSNDEWNGTPHADHRPQWPSADQLPD